jgi:hypothetical protein
MRAMTTFMNPDYLTYDANEIRARSGTRAMWR